jgi:hypothetical protein
MRQLLGRLLAGWTLLGGLVWLGLTTIDPRLSPWLMGSSGVMVSVARLLLPRWGGSATPKGVAVPVSVERLGHDCAKSGRRELLLPLFSLGDVGGRRGMVPWGHYCVRCDSVWRV